MPEAQARELFGRLKQCSTVLNGIDNFKIVGNNQPERQRDTLTEQLRQSVDELTKIAAAWIPYLVLRSGGVDAAIRSALNTITEARQQLREAEQEARAKSAELDTIVGAAREVVAATGAASFSQEFEAEARRLDKQASGWLVFTGIAALCALLGSAYIYLNAKAGLDTPMLIQMSAGRITALAVIVTAALWMGRIYRALRHQASANRHRALSLQTFQAFVQATSDAQTRDAVLIEATRAIFGPSGTGFEGSDGSAGNLQIVEIAKSMTEKS